MFTSWQLGGTSITEDSGTRPRDYVWRGNRAELGQGSLYRGLCFPLSPLHPLAGFYHGIPLTDCTHLPARLLLLSLIQLPAKIAKVTTLDTSKTRLKVWFALLFVAAAAI